MVAISSLPVTHLRDRCALLAILLASLAGCTENAPSGESTAAAGSAGSAGSAGAAPSGIAACAVAPGAVPYTQSCGAGDGSYCLSAWGYRVDGGGCSGVVGYSPCPTDQALAVCLGPTDASVYGKGYESLLEFAKEDCLKKQRKWCVAPLPARPKAGPQQRFRKPPHEVDIGCGNLRLTWRTISPCPPPPPLCSPASPPRSLPPPPRPR